MSEPEGWEDRHFADLGARPVTATRLLEMDARSRLTATMHRLLHRLRRFVEAVPVMEDDKLPEHDVVWVSYPGSGGYEDGPEQVILQTLREHPELWMQAFPVECVVVTRGMLEKQLGRDVADVLASYGENAVLSHAARFRAEREQRERSLGK